MPRSTVLPVRLLNILRTPYRFCAAALPDSVICGVDFASSIPKTSDAFTNVIYTVSKLRCALCIYCWEPCSQRKLVISVEDVSWATNFLSKDLLWNTLLAGIQKHVNLKTYDTHVSEVNCRHIVGT
jgi:hypothetical protein